MFAGYPRLHQIGEVVPDGIAIESRWCKHGDHRGCTHWYAIEDDDEPFEFACGCACHRSCPSRTATAGAARPAELCTCPDGLPPEYLA
jgi:hypothetical protein